MNADWGGMPATAVTPMMARLDVDTQTVVSEDGDAGLLVLTPHGDITVGRERLGALRDAPEPSAVDLQVIEAVRSAPQAIEVVAFCMRGSGGRWCFDPELSTAEHEELAYLLVVSQMRTYLALFDAGVVLHIRCGAGPLEHSALWAAQGRLQRELERAVPPAALESVVNSDREARRCTWIASKMLVFFSRPLEQLTTTTLPTSLQFLRKQAAAARSDKPW